jgi:DNA-binding CsgD family transcriptional regulator
MANCVTCGSELHPERAKKYNYCTAPDCQAKNLTGLEMVAVAVNKAADQYLLLDEQAKADLASGKYQNPRRGSFGPPASTPQRGARVPARAQPRRQPTRRPGQRAGQSARRHAASQPAAWTPSQQRLALLYNEQGMRPDEIAAKLGLSRYLVTQIILGSRNRGKL